jgi:hypothetical protein
MNGWIEQVKMACTAVPLTGLKRALTPKQVVTVFVVEHTLRVIVAGMMLWVHRWTAVPHATQVAPLVV